MQILSYCTIATSFYIYMFAFYYYCCCCYDVILQIDTYVNVCARVYMCVYVYLYTYMRMYIYVQSISPNHKYECNKIDRMRITQIMRSRLHLYLAVKGSACSSVGA